MAKKSKEVQEMHARRWQIIYEVRDLLPLEESRKKYQSLIKICKEFANITDKLQAEGENVTIGAKKYDVKYWEEKYKKFNELNKPKTKTSETFKSKDNIVNNNDDLKRSSDHLYYVMLCWTNKNDYFVCGSVIDRIKAYFEKLKLEFFDTQTTSFPDRTEHCSTFKFRGSEDVYNTIISSAEYIIDISASTVIEHCNVGVFGRMIE